MAKGKMAKLEKGAFAEKIEHKVMKSKKPLKELKAEYGKKEKPKKKGKK
jgi:hypothetical protein